MPAMTIREYFNGRSKRARRTLLIGGVVTAAAAAVFAMTLNVSPVLYYGAVVVGILGAAVMLGALHYLDRTRCPTCHQRLGIQIANQYWQGRRFAFCPFCGIGFDKCEVRNA